LELILDTFREAHPDIAQEELFILSAAKKENTEALRKRIMDIFYKEKQDLEANAEE
jgi:hypothetical protein